MSFSAGARKLVQKLVGGGRSKQDKFIFAEELRKLGIYDIRDRRVRERIENVVNLYSPSIEVPGGRNVNYMTQFCYAKFSDPKDVLDALQDTINDVDIYLRVNVIPFLTARDDDLGRKILYWWEKGVVFAKTGLSMHMAMVEDIEQVDKELESLPETEKEKMKDERRRTVMESVRKFEVWGVRGLYMKWAGLIANLSWKEKHIEPDLTVVVQQISPFTGGEQLPLGEIPGLPDKTRTIDVEPEEESPL